MPRMIVTAREFRFDGKTLFEGALIDVPEGKMSRLLKATKKADYAPEESAAPVPTPPAPKAAEPTPETKVAPMQTEPEPDPAPQPVTDPAADTPRARRRRAMQPAFQPDATAGTENAAEPDPAAEAEDSPWQEPAAGDGVPTASGTYSRRDMQAGSKPS